MSAPFRGVIFRSLRSCACSWARIYKHCAPPELKTNAEFFMSTNTTLVELTHISDEQELRELERKYCSWGDTVHYLEPPKSFDRAEGSYLYDREGTPDHDWQMWYSSASFGYRNKRLNDGLTRQLSKLPKLASQ